MRKNRWLYLPGFKCISNHSEKIEQILNYLVSVILIILSKWQKLFLVVAALILSLLHAIVAGCRKRRVERLYRIIQKLLASKGRLWKKYKSLQSESKNYCRELQEMQQTVRDVVQDRLISLCNCLGFDSLDTVFLYSCDNHQISYYAHFSQSGNPDINQDFIEDCYLFDLAKKNIDNVLMRKQGCPGFQAFQKHVHQNDQPLRYKTYFAKCIVNKITGMLVGFIVAKSYSKAIINQPSDCFVITADEMASFLTMFEYARQCREKNANRECIKSDTGHISCHPAQW